MLTAAQVREHAARVAALREALSAFSGAELSNVLYSLLADHPNTTSRDLNNLSDQLGRAAHFRARNENT